MISALKRTPFAWLLLTTFALVAAPASAQDVDPYRFQKRGFIINAVAAKCWFVQTYEKTNTHFMSPSRKHMTNQNVRTIDFDESECMSNVIDGLDAAEIVN